jgi:glycosyltransferase involved in cell wall biosynthesis
MKHKYGINVLYIITKLELGGAQKVCISLIKGMQEEGHNPLLITGKEGYFVKDFQKEPNVLFVDTFKREISIKYFFKEIINFLKIIKRIRNITKVNDHLIVHTHSTKAGIIGRWAAFFCGVKTRVHTIHGFGFNQHQSWFKWLPIYLLEFLTNFITTHYICVSSEDVKTGLKLFPNFAKKHSIIRASIDWEKFYIPAKKIKNIDQNKEFVFGTISCFKEQKNLFDLLKAFKYVHENNPKTKLEIIGDGALRKDIESWINKNNLQKIIKLHGWQNEVKSIMIEWNTFVLTSLWEGLPCSIVEARMLNLPVISYNTGGIHDIIIPNVNGLLYPQKDWLKLANGMLKISKDNAIYSKFQLYRDDLSDFNSKKMIQEHIQLYKEIT